MGPWRCDARWSLLEAWRERSQSVLSPGGDAGGRCGRRGARGRRGDRRGAGRGRRRRRARVLLPRPPATLPGGGAAVAGDPGQRAGVPAGGQDRQHRARTAPSGLTEADVVFEEMVEGGLTRLLAVYQSQDPETVGPVRSARSTDLSILAELGRPLFAWSGANPTFAAAGRAADIIDVGAGAAPDAYRRADDRRARTTCTPHLSPARRRCRRRRRRDTAEPIFPTARAARRSPGPGPRRPTGSARPRQRPWPPTSRGPGTPAAKRGVRDQDGTAHLDESGEPVRAANVVVRFTPYGDSGVRDSTGALVPEASAVGEGDAWLLSGGGRNPGGGTSRPRMPSPPTPTWQAIPSARARDHLGRGAAARERRRGPALGHQRRMRHGPRDRLPWMPTTPEP